MGSKTAPQVDEQLWFMMSSCCGGKHYLLYNPHTFPGRMGAYCPQRNLTFYVSKNEMEACSVEADYWIRGFLTGNEPPPPRDADNFHLPDDSPQLQRWRAAIRQFPITGIWVVDDRVCVVCGDDLLPTQPGLKCPQCAQAFP